MDGEYGGYRAAFAAGMKYAAMKVGLPSQDKPWLRYFSDEIVYGSIPELTIYDYLVKNNAKFKGDKAILFLGKTIKYRELFAKIKECARALAACGCRKGDVGYIDYNGEIYITGRIKRIAITRGLDGAAAKMFPDRIERAANKCEGIKECCVVEKPDADRVNVAVAFVCVADDEDFESVKAAIVEQCGKDLPDYMLPEEIIQVKELPRTSRGKIDYRKIKEDYLTD